MKVISDEIHARLMALLDDVSNGRLVRVQPVAKPSPAPDTAKTWPWDGLEHQWTAAASVPTEQPREAPMALELPDAVQRASVALSYGSPEQITRNQEYARRALMRGDDAADVIRALTDGEEL